MTTTKPTAPSTNGGHAGLTIARVHNGRSTIGIMIVVVVVVMTTAVTATPDRRARSISIALRGR